MFLFPYSRCHVLKAYWMGSESVVQTGPLLIYTHNLPHLLEAGIQRHQVKEGRTVLFHNS